MGDITLEPIPQESDTCSSFDQLGPRHVHQRSVEEVTLDPSAIQRVQREQLLSIRDRIKESQEKWHEVSDAYLHLKNVHRGCGTTEHTDFNNKINVYRESSPKKGNCHNLLTLVLF